MINTTKNDFEPKIYVACLASYNNGFLHGCWIDATQSETEIMAEISAMLTASPEEDAEEYAIHDYDDFGKIYLSEYESIETVATLAEHLQEHGDLFSTCYEYYSNLSDALDAINDYYVGEYESPADYARELTASIGSVPENLEYYINYESMAEDMEASGDFIALKSDSSYYIFI